jgi:O-antigen/teichoic acid export membrane protein
VLLLNRMSSSSQTLSRSLSFDPAAATGRVIVPLRVGFSWSLVGWVGYAACQWLMLSVMAKMGNSTLVGQFAFALAVCAPVFMLTNLQLRGVQSTDALSEYSFSDYITLRLIGSTVAVLVVAATCPFLNTTYAATCVVLLVALFKSLESLSDVIAGLMQKFEMLDSAAIALLLRGSASIAVFGITFTIWRNLPMALISWISTATLVIIVYDFRVARRLAAFEGGMRLCFNHKTLRTLAITSLPLGFVSAVSSFNTNIPRYTIERVLSVSDLGIFASIAYPVTAATIIANSLGQSALARLSRLFVEHRFKEFECLVLKLVAFGAGLAGIAVVVVLSCGNRLLTLMYTPEYAKQGNLFVILALTAGLNAIACFLSYALTAARQFGVQLPISLLCMLTTFVCSTALVPRFRLMGAAVALLCSACVLIAAASIVLMRVVEQEKLAERTF